MPAANFEIVLDTDGRPKKILRDGARVRVPLMFRDGVNPSLTPLQHSVASRRQLSDAEVRSSRPGFRYGARSALDRQALYDAYDAEIGRAYLTPEGFGGDPRITGAGSHGQRQEPPEGSPCTRNGWPGVWRVGDDGEMFCDIRAAAGRADAKARRARDPDEDDDDDDDDRRVSVAQASSDHQARMARLYDELDRELEAAHRNVKP
jgi:hypothetical protein